MLLPAQDRGSERRPMMLFGRRRRRQAARFAECHQIGAIDLRPRAGGIEGEMQDARRYRDRREGPGVDFAQDRGAQRMLHQPCRFAVADQDLSTHSVFSV